MEEICQLDLDDIRRVSSDGGQKGDEDIWYINITDTGPADEGKPGSGKKSVKTKAGIRKVPLHPFLMGMDGSPVNLLEYAAALGKLAGRPSSFPCSRAARRGQPFRRRDQMVHPLPQGRCGVGGDKGENAAEVTFHSFRHTVITEAKVKDVDRRKVKQMVGHEAGLNEAADITTRYEGITP